MASPKSELQIVLDEIAKLRSEFQEVRNNAILAQGMAQSALTELANLRAMVNALAARLPAQVVTVGLEGAEMEFEDNTYDD